MNCLDDVIRVVSDAAKSDLVNLSGMKTWEPFVAEHGDGKYLELKGGYMFFLPRSDKCANPSLTHYVRSAENEDHYFFTERDGRIDVGYSVNFTTADTELNVLNSGGVLSRELAGMLKLNLAERRTADSVRPLSSHSGDPSSSSFVLNFSLTFDKEKACKSITEFLIYRAGLDDKARSV